MNYKTYLRLRKHNIKLIESYFKSFRFRHLENILFDDCQPFRSQRLSGLNNFWDVIPGTIYGLIPSVSRNGADALEVKPSGESVLHELKLAMVDSSTIRRGPRGGLFKVTQNDISKTLVKASKTQPLNSSVSAYYSKEVKTHIPRDTTLTVYEKSTSRIVGGYTISSEKMADVFKNISASKVVKINVFKREGVIRIPIANIPHSTWDAFCDEMLETALQARKTK